MPSEIITPVNFTITTLSPVLQCLESHLWALQYGWIYYPKELVQHFDSKASIHRNSGRRDSYPGPGHRATSESAHSTGRFRSKIKKHRAG